MAGGQGSVKNPVRLDPFRKIVEVGWPSGGDWLVVKYTFDITSKNNPSGVYISYISVEGINGTGKIGTGGQRFIFGDVDHGLDLFEHGPLVPTLARRAAWFWNYNPNDFVDDHTSEIHFTIIDQFGVLPYAFGVKLLDDAHGPPSGFPSGPPTFPEDNPQIYSAEYLHKYHDGNIGNVYMVPVSVIASHDEFRVTHITRRLSKGLVFFNLAKIKKTLAKNNNGVVPTNARLNLSLPFITGGALGDQGSYSVTFFTYTKPKPLLFPATPANAPLWPFFPMDTYSVGHVTADGSHLKAHAVTVDVDFSTLALTGSDVAIADA